MNLKPILWGALVSPYVRKAYVAMTEKAIDFQVNEILPIALLNALKMDIPEDFTECSPLGRIPALQDNENKVADSAVIVAYLEKQYPNHKSLYPTDPGHYATALWFENYADHVFSQVVYQKIFLEAFVKPKVLKIEVNLEKVNKALNEELPPMLQFLENLLKGKTWLAGNDFSIADIAIATHFVSLKLVGYHMDEAQYPYLSAYIKKILARKSFQQAIAALN